MRYNIGLTYVGNGAYVNEKFTLNPGQSIILTDELGQRLLADFPEWFEEFDGVDDILALGTVQMMEPYNHYNQLAAFEEPETEDEDVSQHSAWDDDHDSATAETPETEGGNEEEVETVKEPEEAEGAEPSSPEEVALDNAVNEFVDEAVTAAVIEKLTEKQKRNKK